MLFVLWDYGIPSISFTLLPRSWIFADDDGRVAAWHPDAKAAAWCWCVPSAPTSPHPVVFSSKHTLLTLWRSCLSHSPPLERLKRRWAISPLSAPAHSRGGLADCVNALSSLFLSWLVFLSFFPYILLPLAKAHARSPLPSSLFTLSFRFCTCHQGKHFSWNVVTCIVICRVLRAIAGCETWLNFWTIFETIQLNIHLFLIKFQKLFSQEQWDCFE